MNIEKAKEIIQEWNKCEELVIREDSDYDKTIYIQRKEAMETLLSELEKKETVINEIEDLCIRKSDDEGEEYGGIIIWNFSHKIMDIIKKVGDK